MEGCDSTTELLPPSRPTRRSGASARKPEPVSLVARRPRSTIERRRDSPNYPARRTEGQPKPASAFVGLPRSLRAVSALTTKSDLQVTHPKPACQPKLAGVVCEREVGGEGRTRTFEATRATDLQSAAFDRSATSPVVCVGFVDVVLAPRTGQFSETRGHHPGLAPMELAKGFEPPTS